MKRLLLSGLVLIVASAGCLTGSGPAATPQPSNNLLGKGPIAGAGLLPTFSVPILVDQMRAGGEPVIAVTPKGTVMIGAHPGYTHYHPTPGSVPPTSEELLVPTQGQSYMWRSTDGGKSFKTVSLLPVDSPNSGPRGEGQGVSDPDWTIDSKGRIYFTDLEALADASVSWSDDDGASFLNGNNEAAGGEIDRNWLASYGTTVYLRGDGANDVRQSTDDGKTFTNTGDSGCTGDFLVNPLNGHMFVGCGDGFSVSKDGGKTFKQMKSGFRGAGPIVPEPAIDAAGTVYRAFDPTRTDIVLAYTKDEGATWGNYSIKKFFPEIENGTMLWPWTSAGSADRVSVTFFGSPTPKSYQDATSKLFVYNAIILNATTANPFVYATKVTPNPIHVGGMCQGGTGCQATTAVDSNSDRRMGDFFESTVAPDGSVHIVYSDTYAKSTDTISHVGYARLVGGPKLVEGVVPPGFPTQG